MVVIYEHNIQAFCPERAKGMTHLGHMGLDGEAVSTWPLQACEHQRPWVFQ